MEKNKTFSHSTFALIVFFILFTGALPLDDEISDEQEEEEKKKDEMKEE